MEDLSQMQKDQIVSWSVQRDTLLKEISVLKDEKGKHLKAYENRGISGEDFLNVSLNRKDDLSNEIENLENDIKNLRSEKTNLTEEVKERGQVISDIQNLKNIQAELIEKNTRLSDVFVDKEQEAKIASLESEISILEQKKNNLIKKNIELAESNTDIEKKIVGATERMKELDKQETLYMEIVDSKLPKLEEQKTKLETFVSELTKEAGDLMDKKDSLTKDIMFLIVTQEDVYNRTGALEKIVEHVTKVSSSNIKELDKAVEDISKKAKEIITLSDSSIKKQNDVLDEIPKLFVELRRKSLVREKL
jgi:chromosome segregation ATPase